MAAVGRPTIRCVKQGWKIAGPAGKRRNVPNEEERVTMCTIAEWHDAALTFADISKVLIAGRVFWNKLSKTARTHMLEFWEQQPCPRAHLEVVRIIGDDGRRVLGGIRAA